MHVVPIPKVTSFNGVDIPEMRPHPLSSLVSSQECEIFFNVSIADCKEVDAAVMATASVRPVTLMKKRRLFRKQTHSVDDSSRTSSTSSLKNASDQKDQKTSKSTTSAVMKRLKWSFRSKGKGSKSGNQGSLKDQELPFLRSQSFRLPESSQCESAQKRKDWSSFDNELCLLPESEESAAYGLKSEVERLETEV